jgi:hypothetical protein
MNVGLNAEIQAGLDGRLQTLLASLRTSQPHDEAIADVSRILREFTSNSPHLRPGKTLLGPNWLVQFRRTSKVAWVLFGDVSPGTVGEALHDVFQKMAVFVYQSSSSVDKQRNRSVLVVALQVYLSRRGDDADEEGESGWYGGDELRRALGVPESESAAFRKAISRARCDKRLRDDDWREVSDRRPNEPMYVFRLDAVRDLAKPFKAKDGQNPA